MNDLFPNCDITNQSSDFDRMKKDVSKIHTRHSYPPAARLPRIVKISLEKKVPFPTRLIRLEFDHSTMDYYSEIDTVILCGTMASDPSTFIEILPTIIPSEAVSYLILDDFIAILVHFRSPTKRILLQWV